MRRLIVGLLAASVIPFGLVVAQSPSGRVEPVISGRVVDAANGVALRRVRVTVHASERWLDPVFTDDEGRFAIRGVAERPVRLRTVKAGYARAIVNLAPDAKEEIVLRLTRGAAISGRVFDAYGAFVADATISGRLIATGGTSSDGPVVSLATTDLLGEYRLGALIPGRYEISVVRRPGVSPDMVRRPQDWSRLDDQMLKGLTLDPQSAATTINLRAGDEIGEIDMTIKGSSATCAPPAPRPRDPSATAAIRGRVIGASGTPLPCATVRLLARGITVRPVTTDLQGRYAIENLPAGTYYVEASHTGYVTLQFRQQRALRPGTPVTLRGDETRDRVDVVLQHAGWIDGTVVDEHGEPLEGIPVQSLQLRKMGGRTTALRPPGAGATRTDDRGHYRLLGLAPGRYLIAAMPEGTRSLPVFYPGAPEVSTALQVAIDVGLDAPDVDLTVAHTLGATVSGFVFDRTGQPFTGMVLLGVSQKSGAIMLEPRAASIDRGGAFTIAGVPPGDYVVQALRAFGERGQGIEFGMQYVTVADRDPPPVKIATSAGAIVEGRVILDGGTAQDLSAVGAFPFPAEFDRAPLVGAGPVGLTRMGEGRFRVTGVTGSRRFVMLSAPMGEGWYLESATVNGVDAADRPFDFGAAETLFPDVEIVVSKAGATIEGHVAGEWHTAGANAAVAVFPIYTDLWYLNSRHVKAARVVQDGTFRVTGLPPGAYYVALANVPDTRSAGAWTDPDHLRELAGSAQQVTLARGERRAIDLRFGAP